MSIDLTFHHFGLATRDAEQTAATLRNLGYELAESIFDPLQNVNLIWCEHATMPAIEVVAPADGPGPLDPYLADHGELIYHLCYVAADISTAVAGIERAGVRLLTVSEPKPAILFGGKHVGFYMARGLGLIEILEDG